MKHPHRITPAEFEAIFAEVIANQATEGYKLTAEEIAAVREHLVGQYLPKRSWSITWGARAVIAVALDRPDLLIPGRDLEVFVMGVLTEAGTAPLAAWNRVERASATGPRWLVRGVLEMIEHGAPEAERSDPIRFHALVEGVAVARAEGWPDRLRRLLGEA